jgi:hypothetical protein
MPIPHFRQTLLERRKHLSRVTELLDAEEATLSPFRRSSFARGATNYCLSGEAPYENQGMCNGALSL